MRRWLAGLGVAALVLPNVGAALHAHAMLSFLPEGERTANPEHLGSLDVARTLLTGVRIPKPASSEPNGRIGELAITEAVPGPSAEGVVLLFHGYSASRDQVEPVAEVFRELGWATVTVDFHGHGHSPGNTTTLGWREAEDVRAVFEAQDARPIGLYGFSMGAAAALRAARNLDVDFVVSEACFARLEDTIRVRFDAMGLPSSPGSELLLFWGGALAGIDARAHNPVDYAANVEAPLLVVQGEQDLRVSLDEARALGGELVVLEGVGHELGAVAAPERFRDALRDFLRSAVR